MNEIWSADMKLRTSRMWNEIYVVGTKKLQDALPTKRM